jgi:hypothetical protein
MVTFAAALHIPNVDNSMPICQQDDVQNLYKPLTEKDASSEIKRLKSQMTTRQIAAYFGPHLTAADVSRGANGVFPRNKIKRFEFGLPFQSTVIVIGGGDIPDGAQVIRALQCHCGQWFVPNHPLRRQCFICGPFRGKRVNP